MQPNFYDLAELPLDPLVENPQLALEALEKKARVWGNSRSAGGNAVRYALYHAELPTMRQELGSTEGLRRLGQQALARRLEEILSTVRLIAGSRQEISATELDALLESANAAVPTHRRLQRATVEKALGSIRLRSGASATQALPQKPQPPADCARLDAGQLREARQLLTTLQEIGLLAAEDSFYTLLDCEADAADELLRQRVDEFDRKQRVDAFTTRNIPHSTPMKNAHTALKRLMRVFFATPQSRHAYDRAMLAEKAERRLLPELRTLAGQPSVSRELFDHYVGELMALRPSAAPRGRSYSQQEAEWMVYEEFCVRHNHPYPQPVAPAPRPAAAPSAQRPMARPVQPGASCPYCGRSYEPGARSCPHCGRVLVRECPSCHHVCPAEAPVCPQCRLSFEKARLSDAALRQADSFCREGRLEEARGSLRLAETHWAANPALPKARRALEARQHQAQKQLHDRIYSDLASPTRGTAKVDFRGRVRLSWAPAKYKGRAVSAEALRKDGYDIRDFRYVILRSQGEKLTGWDRACFLSTCQETSFCDQFPTRGKRHYYMVFACYKNTALSSGYTFKSVVPVPLAGFPAPVRAFNTAVEEIGNWIERNTDRCAGWLSYILMGLAGLAVIIFIKEIAEGQSLSRNIMTVALATTVGAFAVLLSNLLVRVLLRLLRNVFLNSITLLATLAFIWWLSRYSL